MSYRLLPVEGEWIDRSQIIQFFFEDKSFTGYAGDTIASALWASGQKILGRSFKYHRPRGILSGANHDVNALMQWGEKPNVRADVTPIESGMSLNAVNTFGGVEGDRASLLNFLSPFLPVGFYYKTFNSKKLFPFWERLIRRTTGLGKVDFNTPWTRTPKRYDFCDLLIIGAGISGLTAALVAAEADLDVVIVDENARAGGTGLYQLGGNRSTANETLSLIQSVADHPRIRLRTGTIAAGYYADFWIPLIDQTCMTKMRAKAVIVASGAYEQPAVFRNNDLPGVMLASAAQRLIYRYAVKPMQRSIVFTANQDGYRAALDLLAQGIEVRAIVDLRSEIPMSAIVQKVRDRGIAIYPGQAIYEAKANPQRDGVCAAVICPIDANNQPQIEQQQTIACDGILMSVGWAGAANLLYQAGVKMRFDKQLQQFVPDLLPPGVFACGRVNGVYQADHKRLDGERAGRSAVAFLKGETAAIADISTEPELPSHGWAIVSHPQGKNFVDFDEDLQYKDFLNAIQEGFDNIELLKRFTTVGMGPSQGKHSNMNALRILARMVGKTPGQVGTTTARPFFHPVPMSHLAGRGFTPDRRTPLDDRHQFLNAQWMPAGQWRRPEYYQQPSFDRAACIRQEVLAVRQRVGLIDVGTLGKLEMRGKDAAAFLERVYTGRYASLKVGMTRYGVMLDESGVIIDDGVIARLGEDHFYFTTTTSNAAAIYRELSRLNVMWRMDCGIVNLTGARSAVNLAGPLSRAVLSQLTDLDLSEAFPYLAVRSSQIAGIPALLMRVGLVGEWGYEIHVAAQDAPALWDALMQAGKLYNIQPFGVEAQRLLRLEKGHLIVGQDTDGLTTPFEANLTWVVKSDKPFFVGQRSLQIHAKRAPKQILVGFTLNQFSGTAPQECHLIIHSGDIAGRITSIAYSPSLNRHIGLAYIKPELAEAGNQFTVKRSDGSLITATVTPTPFYDPQNLRQKSESPLPNPSCLLFESKPAPIVPPVPETPEKAISLVDVSALPRFGVKGTAAAAWLTSHGFPIPADPNSWLPTDQGRIARLGLTEFLIEDQPETIAQLQANPVPTQVYPVLRQDLAIVLSGTAVHELFAQTCNVNFRSFNPSDRPVVLTSIIGVSVVVAIEDSSIPRYRLWCDRTYGHYFWQTLSEIAAGLNDNTANFSTISTQSDSNAPNRPERPPNPPILGGTEPIFRFGSPPTRT